MSSVPQRYQPSQRLVDDPDELARLYRDEDKSMRAIAEEDAEVGLTRIHEALHEYGIIEFDDSEESSQSSFDKTNESEESDNSINQHKRGRDPPSPSTPNWSAVH